jgi:hypothetical protein
MSGHGRSARVVAAGFVARQRAPWTETKRRSVARQNPLPKFPDFPLEFTLVIPPLGLISLAGAAAFHEASLRTSSPLCRALALSVAFLATLALYAIFLRTNGFVFPTAIRQAPSP